MTGPVNVQRHVRRRVKQRHLRSAPTRTATKEYTVRRTFYQSDGSVWDSDRLSGIFARSRTEARRIARKDADRTVKRLPLRLRLRVTTKVVGEEEY